MALFVRWMCTHLNLSGVYVSIEQPVCSIFKHHPAFLSLKQRVQINALCTWLGAFDRALHIPKGVRIFTCASRHHRKQAMGWRWI
eukprot:9354635-Pyramimonas_sp.AAC.1